MLLSVMVDRDEYLPLINVNAKKKNDFDLNKYNNNNNNDDCNTIKF